MRLMKNRCHGDVTLDYDNVVFLCDEFGWIETKDVSGKGGLIFVKDCDQLELRLDSKKGYTFTVFKNQNYFATYDGTSLKELRRDLQNFELVIV